MPIHRDLFVQASVTDVRGRRIHVEGRLSGDGETLAEARCAFLHVPLEHFLLTPEGRAAAERWHETLNS